MRLRWLGHSKSGYRMHTQETIGMQMEVGKPASQLE